MKAWLAHFFGTTCNMRWIVSDTERLLLCIAAEYARHVAEGFNARSREMDTDLCRLAFFLDPRYRVAAIASKLDPLDTKVRMHIASYVVLAACKPTLHVAPGIILNDARCMLGTTNAETVLFAGFDVDEGKEVGWQGRRSATCCRHAKICRGRCPF